MDFESEGPRVRNGRLPLPAAEDPVPPTPDKTTQLFLAAPCYQRRDLGKCARGRHNWQM